MIWLRARWRALEAEMIRADAFWLGVKYADAPVPFWPTEEAVAELEPALPYSPPDGVDQG